MRKGKLVIFVWPLHFQSVEVLKKPLPKIPLAGKKHVSAQEKLGYRMGEDGGKEILAPVENAHVNHSGNDAHEPAVMLKTICDRAQKERKPGKLPERNTLEIGIYKESQGK